MRVVFGMLLATAMAGSAAGADIRQAGQLVSERITIQRKIVQLHNLDCMTCPGLGLPWGGLRQPYVAELPWGGLRPSCLSVRRIRRVVLVRKG